MHDFTPKRLKNQASADGTRSMPEIQDSLSTRSSLQNLVQATRLCDEYLSVFLREPVIAPPLMETVSETRSRSEAACISLDSAVFLYLNHCHPQLAVNCITFRTSVPNHDSR